jgi:hypothetical protein
MNRFITAYSELENANGCGLLALKMSKIDTNKNAEEVANDLFDLIFESVQTLLETARKDNLKSFIKQYIEVSNLRVSNHQNKPILFNLVKSDDEIARQLYTLLHR